MSIRRTVTIDRSIDAAFERFTSELTSWWPSTYTWSGDVLEEIGIEARAGGHCFELGPDGFSSHWGTVVECESPSRLLFIWQISPSRVPVPNPRQASEVEVRFESVDRNTTEVTLEHRHFERHGETGDDYRRAMNGPEGWTYILTRFSDVKK